MQTALIEYSEDETGKWSTIKITIICTSDSMMHCLTVRGVDEQSQALRLAFFNTPILAGALWIN